METLSFEIAETAHAMRRAFDRKAAMLGVTRAQWRVLFRLSRSPGLRQVELAEMLDVEPITLSRILDRLADAGLVDRLADPDDRRARRLHLTTKAEPTIVKLRRVADRLFAEAVAGIEPDDLARMKANLAAIRKNLAAAEPIRKVANQ